MDSKTNAKNLDLIVTPAVQNILRLINLLLSAVKSKTANNFNRLLSKINLSKHLRKGWQLSSKTVVRAFTKVVNHVMESEEFNRMLPVLECSLQEPTSNCSSFNDLEHLNADDLAGIYQQWQIAEIRPPRRRCYNHLQQMWKKQARPSSRCSSVMNNFSPPLQHTSSLLDENEDDELDELDCERLSQVSGSIVTTVNAADAQSMKQTLELLQKQMAMILQFQQQQQAQQPQIVTQNQNQLNVTFTNAPLQKTAPPPAPPPPPPDFFNKKKPLPSTPSSTVVTATILTTASRTKVATNDKPNSNALPRIMDILKDIGNVKLRKVEGCRSPNGTPMRHANDSRAEFLAQALEKQFRNVRLNESDDDTDTNSNGAWDDENETQA